MTAFSPVQLIAKRTGWKLTRLKCCSSKSTASCAIVGQKKKNLLQVCNEPPSLASAENKISSRLSGAQEFHDNSFKSSRVPDRPYLPCVQSLIINRQSFKSFCASVLRMRSMTAFAALFFPHPSPRRNVASSNGSCTPILLHPPDSLQNARKPHRWHLDRRCRCTAI